jgi:hypothetical protein
MIAYALTVTGSPVQFGLWIMALWLTSNGPGAYLTCTAMLSDPTTACTTQVVGFIPVTVNLCHTLCHLLTGIVGLAAILRRSWAIVYTIFCGVFYIVWGLLGAFGGEHIRHHLGVDMFGTWVHVVEGSILLAICLGDWLTSRPGDRAAATSTN